MGFIVTSLEKRLPRPGGLFSWYKQTLFSGSEETEVVRYVKLDEYGLTELQKKFCDYYITLGKGAEAAIKAGYSEKNARFYASRTLQKPAIKKYIGARLKQMEEERIADAKEVLRFLTSSMRGDIKEEVVVVEGNGDGCSSARTLEKQIGAGDRIKAATLLAKRYGLDKPDEVDGDAQITFNFDRGDDHED